MGDVDRGYSVRQTLTDIRIESTNPVQGLVMTITTHDSASGGSVVSKVDYVYNYFPQSTDETQTHD